MRIVCLPCEGLRGRVHIRTPCDRCRVWLVHFPVGVGIGGLQLLRFELQLSTTIVTLLSYRPYSDRLQIPCNSIPLYLSYLILPSPYTIAFRESDPEEVRLRVCIFQDCNSFILWILVCLFYMLNVRCTIIDTQY